MQVAEGLLSKVEADECIGVEFNPVSSSDYTRNELKINQIGSLGPSMHQLSSGRSWIVGNRHE